MSSSSPIAAAFSNSLATFSTIFGFFKVFVGALGLDFEVGPSNERADATSFKEVVRDFNNLGAALELRLESGVLWVVDLRIIVSKCYSKGCYLPVSACGRSLSVCGCSFSASGRFLTFLSLSRPGG